MPDITPLTLPSLTATAVALSNQVARKRGTPLDLPGPAGATSYVLSPPAPAMEASVVASLDIDGHPVWLELEPRFLAELCAPLLPAEDYPALPAALQRGVLQAALSGPIERFIAATGLAVEVRETSSSRPTADLSFGIRPAVEAAGCCATLWFDARSLEFFLALLERIPDGAPADLSDLPFRCRVQMGHIELPLETFGALAVNDLVVLRDSPYADGRRVTVVIEGERRFPGRAENGTIIIEAEQELEEKAMSDDQTEGTADEEAVIAGVDELPVELQFELGSATLPLAELRRMEPGFSFDLRRTLPEVVTIRANGKTIGSGELVDIDGQVGVRVTRLFGAD